MADVSSVLKVRVARQLDQIAACPAHIRPVEVRAAHEKLRPVRRADSMWGPVMAVRRQTMAPPSCCNCPRVSNGPHTPVVGCIRQASSTGTVKSERRASPGHTGESRSLCWSSAGPGSGPASVPAGSGQFAPVQQRGVVVEQAVGGRRASAAECSGGLPVVKVRAGDQSLVAARPVVRTRQ